MAPGGHSPGHGPVHASSFRRAENTLIDPTSLPAFQALARYLQQRRSGP